jgi:hypothetical protein
LLLYSSKPSLGVFQLAGYFTSPTNAIKLSSIIITAPPLLRLVAGEGEERGVEKKKKGERWMARAGGHGGSGKTTDLRWK